MAQPSTQNIYNHILYVWPSQTRRTVDLVKLKDIVLHRDRIQTKYRHKCTNNEPLVSNEVSTSLVVLRHLKYLDLSMNCFQGSRIPKFIGSLKELTYLNLSYAMFSGIIPHHIGNLSNLITLDLSSNDYNKNLLIIHDMAWISSLSSLEHLNLGWVNLRGAKNLDMVLYIIPLLKELTLRRCGLSNVDLGPLRNSSTSLSNIKHLDLSENSFKGQPPPFFQNMTSLQFLDLSLFNFSLTWNFATLISMVPSLLELHLSSCNLEQTYLSHSNLNFTTLSNIQHLDLSHNFFPESFPSIFANMTSLRVLDLSASSLNASVPVMPNLLELDLSANNFKKFEDVGIWRQCHLKKVSVNNNAFDMELTDSTTNISECSQYALEMLVLQLSLNGTFPKSLGRMANLRHLDVSYNLLTGIIPEFLGRLRLLQALDLSKNDFTNSIPKSLGRLPLLRILDLSRNKLTGPIPTFLGKLTKLDLSSNNLNGSIPKSLGRLTTLMYLFLQNNQLTGPIPASIGRLVSLQSFLVSSNFLSGAIPVSIGQLSKLRSLDVSNNSLEGVVSESHFHNLSMLKSLNVALNSKLTFNISCEWLPPFQLLAIDLSSCNIANRFPQWLRNQRKLTYLGLSNASISGPLPTWLRKMPIIPIINLSHNNLSGRMTNLPSGGTDLGIGYSTLSLQHNLFNESIPRSLCKRKHLYELDLSYNRLTGKIPNCLKNLQKLFVMILSSNELSGVIPSFIGNISSLMWLKLNDNNFSGEFPTEFGNLSQLEALDLADNAFCGKIPELVGEKFKSLRVLRLHKNNFTGGIPRSLCKNVRLQILDVAHNNLTGTIPHCLGKLKGMAYNNEPMPYPDDTEEGVIQVVNGAALEYTKTWQLVMNMDLSSNKLVGEIPVELTELYGLMGLNLSNNHLSGGIPDNIGNMAALISLDLSGNELDGQIPPSIAALNFLSHLNLSNNNLSGRIPTGSQLQTLIDPSIYAGNKDLCGAPLPTNCSIHEDPSAIAKRKYEATDEPNKVWFYMDITCGFATGFWGVIVVLMLKKQWRHKLFIFAEETRVKIDVAILVRVNKLKRGREAI
ncbi:putative non-specific serine/threonine protein kinase [Helianthus annuus]|nr:putative non-specific serine/threonine protein kinase [Helianthus annuus]